MKILSPIACAIMTGFLVGCDNDQKHSTANTPTHLHVDTPPHGGTPVALGDDYQIEWVLDEPAGKLQAFVMDGEMENFVRIAPTSFDLAVKLPNTNDTLRFMAIANSATGEKIGSTSLFEARADWLKTNKTFDAVLKEINVEWTVYTNVAFNFPKGNEDQAK